MTTNDFNTYQDTLIKKVKAGETRAVAEHISVKSDRDLKALYTSLHPEQQASPEGHITLAAAIMSKLSELAGNGTLVATQ